MPLVATAVVNQDSLKTWNVTGLVADAAGATVVIPHGFVDTAGVAAAPEVVILSPVLEPAYVGTYIVFSVDATNITVEKGTTGAGSGEDTPLPLLQIIAMLPHTMIRG